MGDLMKALTLHQPWASLVALGVKPIETRGWKPSASAIGQQLLIHAAARPVKDGTRVGDFVVVRDADDGWQYLVRWPAGQPLDPAEKWHPFPLGAVVATCTLVDVVPIYRAASPEYRDAGFTSYVLDGYSMTGPGEYHLQLCDWAETASAFVGGEVEDRNGTRYVKIEHQRPYGDFTPGRYAWLLADVVALPKPIPAKGRQGLWTLAIDLAATRQEQS